MPLDIHDVVFSSAAIAKLSARNIAETEIAQLLWNRYRTAHNPNGADPERRFLIGTTNGGRCLTVVITPTADPTTWLVITAWDSTAAQRKILEG